MAAVPSLQAIKAAGSGAPPPKGLVARALAALEAAPGSPEVVALLSDAWAAPQARVIGLTGPPGVGKSTLIGALIRHWRGQGRSVAVIAVDPSSKRSGGALLGDRTRLKTDPGDNGLYVRSMAARERLGGLASLTMPAMVLMRALYDIVLIETVGVGQSETEVSEVADTVIFCIQPASGDSLQYMKAGIMEVPHVMAVTKADMGSAARRARNDVAGALSLSEGIETGWRVPVLMVSASTGDGIAELAKAADDHQGWLAAQQRLDPRRRAQGEAWLRAWVMEHYGRRGLAKAGAITLGPEVSPFAEAARIAARLDQCMR